MLINTVILFLKDLLPIFILLCLLKVNNANAVISKKVIFIIVLLSIFGVIATFKLLPLIGEMWDGTGIEILQTIEVLLVYVLLVFSYSNVALSKYSSVKQLYFISSAIVIFVTLNTSVFIVFLDSYITSSEFIKHIIAGLAIGLGICLSFSFLMYFLLVWLNKKQRYLVTYTFWALFLTGQLSQIINLLQQVDIIKSRAALWNSSTLVEDSSEYGHLFNTLFGYEARPSSEFITLYLGSLLVLYGYFFIQLRHKISESKQPEGRNYEH